MKNRQKLRNRIRPYVVARQEFWDVPRAIQRCRKISEKDKDSLHMLVCDHIGDFIYTMGYIDALRKQTGYERIAIYVTEKFAKLAEEIYPNTVDNIVVLEARALYSLFIISSTRSGIREYKKLKNLLIVNPTNAFTIGNYEYIENYKNLSFSDCIKYGCLELEEDAVFLLPDIETYRKRTRDLIQEKADYTNAIIIVPYARHLMTTDKRIWKDIVNKLNCLGYKTYTALADNSEESIEGSEPLVSSLSELPIYAEKAKAVIGMRSGIFDLLAYTDTKLIAIYPEDCKNMSFYSLSHLPGHTAKYVELKESDIIEQIQNKESLDALFD